MISGARHPWTSAEDEFLRQMALSEENPVSIALRLNRTEDAVRSRAFRLRIPLKGLKVKK